MCHYQIYQNHILRPLRKGRGIKIIKITKKKKKKEKEKEQREWIEN